MTKSHHTDREYRNREISQDRGSRGTKATSFCLKHAPGYDPSNNLCQGSYNGFNEFQDLGLGYSDLKKITNVNIKAPEFGDSDFFKVLVPKSGDKSLLRKIFHI